MLTRDPPPAATQLEDPPVRLLHQRVTAVVLRAGAVWIGAAPLALFPLVNAWLEGTTVQPEFLYAWLLFGLGAAVVFAFERRDASAPEIYLRAYLSVVCASVLLPLAWIAVSNPGTPLAALNELAQGLAGLHPPFGLGVWGPLLASVPFLLLYTRSALGSGVTQGLALFGVGIPGALAVGALGEGFLTPFGWLLGAPLATVALARVDARLEELDPLAPRARERRHPFRRALGLVVVLVGGLAFALPNLIEARKWGNEAAAIGALKTLNTAQTFFREGDKEQDGQFDYAANLGELGEATPIDAVLAGGVKQGYAFRLTHSATTSEFLWAAAAEPLIPGVTGTRYFFTDQTGVVAYRTTGAFDLKGESRPYTLGR